MPCALKGPDGPLAATPGGRLTAGLYLAPLLTACGAWTAWLGVRYALVF